MRHIIPPALLALLAGCTVGPDYHGPVASPATTPRAAFVRAGEFIPAAEPALADWWTAFGDTTLNALEARALAGNPGIAVAEARLRQARAGLRLERANGAPTVNTSATYLHATLPGVNIGQANDASTDDGSQSLNFYNVGFDASWELDLFGGHRRSLEAARAQLGAAQANVADAQLSLTADVARTYVSLRDVQNRLALARRSAAMQRQMLDLLRQRFDRGAVSALDVERFAGQVETTEGGLIPLQAQIASYQNALAVLAGEQPGELDAVLSPAAAVPLPPAAVPVGDPAALLRRRPDIIAAERRLAQRTAQIGTAQAARLPRLSLLGLIGIGGTRPGDVLDPDNLTALAVPMLQWNALDFGRGAARVRQAEGARDEAEAQYRSAVLTALRDAEDALSRFGARRQSVASAARARASAARAADLMQQRFRAGTATLIDTLDAERQRIAAEDSLSSATANLTGDYIALQKALGLGWTSHD
ncbi:RND transporter [Sphingomonas sp. Root710]|uniref:efflux transporter outer membrane subunit n=1 Tax=Sphingomonas sp. Root710 TaxID=1736594 RepID=UPI0006FD044F|nr:efflux transporter outer membrane subunit [Sphingomonas sp. Root710]KRB85374.1 RND transporter [Sphingomonas sp. Root710]